MESLVEVISLVLTLASTCSGMPPATGFSKGVLPFIPGPIIMHPLEKYIETQLNVMCGGSPPTECTCEFGPVKSIRAPFTQGQLAGGCKPGQCKCEGEEELIDAPEPDFLAGKGGKPPGSGQGPPPAPPPKELILAQHPLHTYIERQLNVMCDGSPPTECACMSGPVTEIEAPITFEQLDAGCQPAQCKCAGSEELVDAPVPDFLQPPSNLGGAPEHADSSQDPPGLFRPGQNIEPLLLRHPLYNYFKLHLSVMCDGSLPTECTCKFGPVEKIEGPLTFEKLATAGAGGCQPEKCKCAGRDELVPAPIPDFLKKKPVPSSPFLSDDPPTDSGPAPPDRSAVSPRITLPKIQHPLQTYIDSQLNIMCSDSAPETCTCQFGNLDRVDYPFTVGKLLNCKPLACKCPGQADLLAAPEPDFVTQPSLPDPQLAEIKDKINKYIDDILNRLCDGQAPTECSCTFDLATAVRAPFTPEALEKCLVDTCSCAGTDERVRVPDFAKAVGLVPALLTGGEGGGSQPPPRPSIQLDSATLPKSTIDRALCGVVGARLERCTCADGTVVQTDVVKPFTVVPCPPRQCVCTKEDGSEFVREFKFG